MDTIKRIMRNESNLLARRSFRFLFFTHAIPRDIVCAVFARQTEVFDRLYFPSSSRRTHSHARSRSPRAFFRLPNKHTGHPSRIDAIAIERAASPSRTAISFHAAFVNRIDLFLVHSAPAVCVLYARARMNVRA